VIAFTPAACDDAQQQRTGGVTQINAWFHTGQEGEHRTIQDQVARFNQLDPIVHVRLMLIPERSYNTQAQTVLIAGNLHDILEFDGPDH
jgi:ABC-type glycerol-3-phosphate transport system substrate-binding protein